MARAAWCTRHPRGGVVKDYFWRRSRRKFLAWEVGPCSRFWEDKWAMGRTLIVLGYVSCNVVKYIITLYGYTDLYGLKWKSICYHRLPLSSLVGYRIGNPFKLYTKSRWNWWNHCISLPWLSLAGTKTPKESLRSMLLWTTCPEGPACSLRPGHCGYAAAMAPEETGKDAQDDENTAMAQKHLQVVFAPDIEEAAAFELLNNLCHSSPEKLNFYRCFQIPSSAWQKLRGASWTNLRQAVFSWCLVLQTWLRCLASSDRRVFFSQMLRAIVTAVSLTTFDNIERQKMWNRQWQMVGLAKVTCKRSGNRLPSFYRLPW